MDDCLPENIALVDLDGTVADWHNRLRRDVRAVLGDDEEKLPPETITKIEHLVRGQPGWYLGLDPLPVGFAVVDLLQKIGFSLMVATKATTKAKNAWSEKAAWCEKHWPGIDVTVTANKTIIYGKILVDDYQKFAEPWLKRRPRGYVIMPDQPWNQGFEHERVLRVKTVQDVAALKPKLLEIYNR